MNHQDLMKFKKEVSDPTLEKVFATVELPEGRYYIDDLSLSFLDGNNCGVDYRLKVSGYNTENGQSLKYSYDEYDVQLSDFLKDKDVMLIAEGKLTIKDELAKINLECVIHQYNTVKSLFHWMPDLSTLGIKIKWDSIEYDKIKYLMNEQASQENNATIKMI